MFIRLPSAAFVPFHFVAFAAYNSLCHSLPYPTLCASGLGMGASPYSNQLLATWLNLLDTRNLFSVFCFGAPRLVRTAERVRERRGVLERERESWRGIMGEVRTAHWLQLAIFQLVAHSVCVACRMQHANVARELHGKRRIHYRIHSILSLKELTASPAAIINYLKQWITL